MKKTYFLLFAVFMAIGAFAQIPDGWSYQAVVRDADGKLKTGDNVYLRFTVLDGANAVYQEIQQIKTDEFGIVTATVGNGVSQFGNFSEINWAMGTYFFKTEMSLGSVLRFEEMGTSELGSVPFSFLAKNSLKATNADYATNAGNATNADYATNAGNATNADYATNAGNATNADYATNADKATNADYATVSGTTEQLPNGGTTGQILYNTGTDIQWSAYSLPTSDGAAGEVLKTDGNGNVTWGAVAGAGGVWTEKTSPATYYELNAGGMATNGATLYGELANT